MLVLPLLWWFSNGFLHESSHLLSTRLVGGTVIDYQLVPRFWRGDYGKAWINSANLDSGRLLITTAAPYFVNCVTLFAGLTALRGPILGKPFLAGFLVMLLVLRPTYEFMSELTALIAATPGSDYAIIAGSLGTSFTCVFAGALAISSWACVFSILSRIPPKPVGVAEPGAPANANGPTPASVDP